MGLDGVEIAMELEDRFGVRLPDDELQNTHTVADIAALIISQLPKVPPAVCPTASSFYQLRRALMQVTSNPRARIRPHVDVRELLPAPPFRRRAWMEMRRHHPGLPRPELPQVLDRAIMWAMGGSCLLLVFATFVLVAQHGPAAGFALSFALAAGVLVLFAVLVRSLSWALPAGITTVGELARDSAARHPGIGGASRGERLMMQVRVLETVRQTIADIGGIPLQQIRPESRFSDLLLD